MNIYLKEEENFNNKKKAISEAYIYFKCTNPFEIEILVHHAYFLYILHFLTPTNIILLLLLRVIN